MGETMKVGDPVWVPNPTSWDYPTAGTLYAIHGTEAVVEVGQPVPWAGALDQLERRETTQEEKWLREAEHQQAIPIQPCGRCGRPATRLMFEVVHQRPVLVTWACELFGCGDDLEGLYAGPPWVELVPGNPTKRRG